jgi:cystathionine beta-lyase
MAFDFDTPINRRGTGCVKWDLYPEEYLPMFVADSDFAVPEQVRLALLERINHPVYGYGLPSPELIDAFLGWFEGQYGLRPEKDWLQTLPGIVPALSVASRIYEGSSITVTPNYPMLLSAPERAGREMIKVPLKNEDEFYSFDFDGLQSALREDTKIFYLCNPQNPVGRVYTKEELLAVSDFAEKNGLIVVSDEIHCEIVYDRPHIPFFTVSDYARENSVTLMAPGKTYNLPGVSMAFAIIPNKTLKNRFKQEGYALGQPGIFNTAAATAAYRDSGQWRDEMVSYLKANRDFLENEIKRRLPKARLTHTEGTYLQWVDLRAYGINGGDDLKEKAKIIANDGAPFGAPGYVRINFGCTRATLEQALEQICAAVEVS